jgi:hypothetical protein
MQTVMHWQDGHAVYTLHTRAHAVHRTALGVMKIALCAVRKSHKVSQGAAAPSRPQCSAVHASEREKLCTFSMGMPVH